MNHEAPIHLADKYRLYAIWLEEGFENKLNQNMMIVHVGRPISFATLCETFIFQHPELTIEKTGKKIKTNIISGIQKVKNDNKPQYELTIDGTLKEIL